MLEIQKNSLDQITLGLKKNDIPKNILENKKYFLEFDKTCKKQSESKLITISVSNEKEFSLNGEIINFNNFGIFVKTENPLYEIDDSGSFYIFPNYNLVLYINDDQTEFMQILIYDKSVKDFYENERLPRYLEIENSKCLKLSSNKLILIPYKSIGKFVFGCKIVDFSKQFGLDLNNFSEKKEIIELDNFLFRFDDLELTQVTIFNYNKDSNLIYYKDIDLSTELGLLNLRESTNNVIERTASKYLFPDLGLVIEKDLSEFRIFAQPLLKFWSNIHRPITSW